MALVVVPAPAFAGKPIPRVGFLVLEERNCRNEHPIAGLRDLGYEPGKNIVIDCRHAGGREDRLAQVAAELAHSRPAAIVALNHNWALAAQRATKDIPLVVVSSGDPVESGFAGSMARPGGNVTGLTYFATELNAKRLEFLSALVPKLKHVAVIKYAKLDRKLGEAYLREIHTVARTYGMSLTIVDVEGDADLESAFEQIVSSKAQAVYVLAAFRFGEQTEKIADLAAWNNLPSMHFHRRYTTVGGLMSYAPDYDQIHRRTAIYVDKILKGAKPAELPFEQPERFELSINLKTARDLELKVPQFLLLRADKVIE